MTEEIRPIAVEPPAAGRPANREPGVAGDPDSAVRPPATDGDESTPALPEDVGWPGRGEPCA